MLLSVSLALLFIAQAGLGDPNDFWKTKDYRTWSKEECAYLLYKSPWVAWSEAGTNVNLELQQVDPPRGPDPPRRLPEPGIRDSGVRTSQAPAWRYRAELRSALPLRQAQVRNAGHLKNYDSLPAGERAKFDQDAEDYLLPSTDLVIFVELPTPQRQYWEKQTTASLKSSVFLAVAGKPNVPLREYKYHSSTLEFHLAFPRTWQGRPVLEASDKTLELRMKDHMGWPMVIRFNVEGMLLNGQVQY